MNGVSRRQQRIIELAGNVASQSDYVHKMGAVLVRGGAVINTACNKASWNSFAARFVHMRETKGNDYVNASLHSEVGVILGLSRDATEGSDVYIVRLLKKQKFGLAKPCGMCQGAMRAVGVRRVFYTTSENTVEKMILI